MEALITPVILLVGTYLFQSRNSEPEPAQDEFEPEKYDKNLRIRKNVFLVLLSALLGNKLVEIGFNLVQNGLDGSSLSFLNYLITIFIASVSYGQLNRSRQFDYIVSLTIIMFILSANSIVQSLRNPPSISTFISILLESAAFILIGSTDRSPPLIQYFSTIHNAPPPFKNSTERNRDERTPLLFDDAVHPYLEISRVTSCSPFSFLSFSWVTPSLKKAKHLDFLSEEDLPVLSTADQAEVLWKKIERKRLETLKKDFSPRLPINELLWLVLTVEYRLFLWQFGLAFLNAFMYYLPAFFLQKLVSHLDSFDSSDKEGYILAFGLFLSLALSSLVDGALWFVSNSMLATRIRSQLNSMIFDKTLKRKDITGSTPVSNGIREEGTAEQREGEEGVSNSFNSKSQVMNLFTIDVERVADFSIWGFSLLDVPLEIIIGTIFLYQLLGNAALVGISISILFLPINSWASSQFADVEKKLMIARDKRTSLISELISSIRMIKFFAAEESFKQRILDARNFELTHLRRSFFLEVAFNFIWSTSPILCILASFAYYTGVMGKKLDPSTAFAALAVFNELRFALNAIPEILVNAIQCLVSLRRISAYLKLPEVGFKEPEERLLNPGGREESIQGTEIGLVTAIGLVNATVSWPLVETEGEEEERPGADTPAREGEEEERPGAATPARVFALQDITIDFPLHQLSLITGAIGSGKSLLLHSLLGEASLKAGRIIRPTKAIDVPSLLQSSFRINDANWIEEGRTAYVPQSAWLQSNSIKQNILFGSPFNAIRYSAVLEACSLVKDLGIFEDGDETQIGEKGVALSGGMKARVSLARAVYSRASYLLLDDVLAAVDAHTQAHLNEKCFKGPLLAGRTVILVSHQVSLIASSFVVVLDNGRVTFQGNSEQYSAKYTPIVEEEEEIIEKIAKPNRPKPKPRFSFLKAEVNDDVSTSEASSASEAESDDSEGEIDTEMKKPRKMIEDETRKIGRVGNEVWGLYLTLSGSVIFWIAFASIYLGTKGFEVAETLWLARWSRSYNTESGRGLVYYLGIYALLSFAQVIISTLQYSILYNGSIKVSEKLHRMLLSNILKAPLRFFEVNSAGRLLNRFGNDLEKIDSVLPDNVGRTLMLGLGVITTLVVIAVSAPMTLAGFAVLSIFYYRFAILFSKAARELRRLDSVSKSPLYSIYDEAISGAAVIRAFGSEARFMKEFLARCQTNTSFYWYLWSTNRWLSIRFAFLSSIVIALTATVLLYNRVEASLAGFTLTFALMISNDILFLVRRFTGLELTLVALERIKEYSEVPQEAEAISSTRPPPNWPTGAIEFKGVGVRYSDELPNVLHDVTFSIQAGQKVGIVGSTGSGKSTIALSLFRFIELQNGAIKIDGIDIKNLGLYDLRSNLTIIPQDPSILSGTLRSTLDMFGEYSDEEIFTSLRNVSLIEAVEPTEEELEAGANRSIFYDLDGPISEGGSNISQGERQLICMARALLKKNRVIIMDEATASVDSVTDAAIGNTIRSSLKGSTLIVIAHRLRTIIDFDKVLLLDAGRVVEFDSPASLLANPSSRFYSLCRATGKHEFKVLRRIADGKDGKKKKKEKKEKET